MQKARCRFSAPTACGRTVSGSLSLPCPGCFPPFPHGTGSLSVFRSSLALRDGPRCFGQDSSCPALLRHHSRTTRIARTGMSPSSSGLSRPFRFSGWYPVSGPTTPAAPRRGRFGLLPFRSPLLRESMFLSFPPGTEMFQFPGFAHLLGVTGLQPAGLPHSDTRGSIHACRSPRFFAACRVLPRRRKPRHPPSALGNFLCESNDFRLAFVKLFSSTLVKDQSLLLLVLTSFVSLSSFQ